MFDQLKTWILKLFGLRPRQTDDEISDAQQNVSNYQDVKGINFTSIFANSLTMLALSDCSVNVDTPEGIPQTERVNALDAIIRKQWESIKENIEIGTGCGMVVSIPYVVNTPEGLRVYVDTVSQDRFLIMATQGDEITSIAVLADYFKQDGKEYKRFAYYYLDGKNYVIENKAMRGSTEIPLTEVEEWSTIQPKITISNVSRLPVGIYKCPANSRSHGLKAGVPITYGCDDTIQHLQDILQDLDKEFAAKHVKLFADDTLLDRNNTLSADVYQPMRPGGRLGTGSLIEVFDPAIRTSPYFDLLMHYMSMLERQVGTSRGILTDLQLSGSATVPEIKRAMKATFSLCNKIQINTKAYVEGLVYGVDVLMDAFRMHAASDYVVKFDFNYDLLEDTNTEFSQLAEGYSLGVVGPEELRQFLRPGEALEESIAYLEQLRQNIEVE